MLTLTVFTNAINYNLPMFALEGKCSYMTTCETTQLEVNRNSYLVCTVLDQILNILSGKAANRMYVQNLI